MSKQLRLLALELGSTAAGREVLEELRVLVPGIWIAGVEKQSEFDETAFDLVLTTQPDAFLGRYESVDTAELAMTPELSMLMAPFEGKILNLLGLAATRPATAYPPPIRGVPRFRDSYDDRKDLFNRHCRYWNYILDFHQIDAIVHENLGQEGYDYIALQLARAKGIPTLVFNITGQLPRVLFVQEDEMGLGNLDLGFTLKQRIKPEITNEDPLFIRRSMSSIKSSPDAGLRSRSTVTEYKTSPFVSWLFDRSIHKSGVGPVSGVTMLGTKFFRFLKSPQRSLRTLLRTQELIRHTRRSQREELENVVQPRLSRSYVYFPLHFQPETSSSIKAKSFYRLREAVAFLAAALPEDWSLVVKEHPHQFRRLLKREPGFFAQIAAISKVQLVHHATDNEALVRGARAVACVSHSSITANAALRGIPVISLGESHFREAPNYYCVGSSVELRNIVELIQNTQLSSSTTNHDSFIMRLESSTFEGEFGEQFEDVSNEDWTRTMAATRNNISRVIREWLRMRGLVN
jgi:hypothetical protein